MERSRVSDAVRETEEYGAMGKKERREREEVGMTGEKYEP